MTRMSPPRRPRGEKAATTIALQQKQIRDLTVRVDDLTGLAEGRIELVQLAADDRDAAIRQMKAMHATANQFKAEVEAVQAKLAQQIAYHQGYRQRVYDEKLDATRAEAAIEDLPAFPTGAQP